jgi:L-ascorbate metabolism protein UlaG (beta-lactamase superfamily)
MKITKFGHACLFVEDNGGRLLIDPGAWSSGFEDLTELDAILITHQHQDHMLPENIQGLLAKNPEAKVYADEASAKLLAEAGVRAQAVHTGDEFEAGGVAVAVFGKNHAMIHPDIPGIPDVGYLIAGGLLHPGDALTVPDRAVEILAVPAGAPWEKVEEEIDYVRAVKPKVAIPIHDAPLSDIGRELHFGLLKQMGQAGELRVIENGSSTEV